MAAFAPALCLSLLPVSLGEQERRERAEAELVAIGAQWLGTDTQATESTGIGKGIRSRLSIRVNAGVSIGICII